MLGKSSGVTDAGPLVAKFIRIADRLAIPNATLAGFARLSLPTVRKLRRGEQPKARNTLALVRVFVEHNAGARTIDDLRPTRFGGDGADR